MKKALLSLAILSSLLFLTSCDNKIDDLTKLQGNYKLSMDGKVVAEGTTEEVGKLALTISMYNGEDFGIIIMGTPSTIGTELNLDGSEASITINGKNLLADGSDEFYVSQSGTVTRTSSDKISFEGECTDFSGNVYNFNGYVESNVY